SLRSMRSPSTTVLRRRSPGRAATVDVVDIDFLVQRCRSVPMPEYHQSAGAYLRLADTAGKHKVMERHEEAAVLREFVALQREEAAILARLGWPATRLDPTRIKRHTSSHAPSKDGVEEPGEAAEATRPPSLAAGEL